MKNAMPLHTRRHISSVVSGFVLLATAAFPVCHSQAQTPPPATPPAPIFRPPPSPNDTLKSPEVQPDGHVLFRVYAPKATDVRLRADGVESTPGATLDELMKSFAGVAMTKGDDGVWSVLFGPIQPGVYRYNFIVDGVSTPDPRNPLASESLNSVSSLYEVSGAAFLEMKPDVPHGAIATIDYPSSVVGGLRRMHVYTPPGYENGSKRYPVLYLLHGGGDSDDAWPTVGRAGAIEDNLIATHGAEPMIIVMPAGHVSRDFQLSTGQMTMGHDKFNADLTDVVLPFVDQHFRTLPDRQHRALAGLSMGGLQTLTLSLDHSALFGSIGVFSSGWFPGSLAEIERTDLATYKRGGKPYKVYWMGAGKLDIAYQNSLQTVALLKQYGIQPDYHLTEGFHAWNNWRDYLHSFLPLLFTR